MYKFTCDTTIEMPETTDIAPWIAFFNQLETVDYFAPFHAVMSRYQFVSDEDYRLMPAAFGDLYYNLGIEMCAADRYPAEEAAIQTGFYGRGICMIVCAVVASCGQDPDLMAIARDIFQYPEEVAEYVPEGIVAMAKELLQN